MQFSSHMHPYDHNALIRLKIAGYFCVPIKLAGNTLKVTTHLFGIVGVCMEPGQIHEYVFLPGDSGCYLFGRYYRESKVTAYLQAGDGPTTGISRPPVTGV